VAIIKCTECGKEISSEALDCPGCGKPQTETQKSARRKKRGNTQGAGCLIILIGGGLCLLSPAIGAIAFIVGFVILLIGLVG